MDCNTVKNATPTPAEFVDLLFPPDLLAPNERVVIAHPDSFIKAGEEVTYYRQMNFKPQLMRSARSWYFCVSAIEAQQKRQVKKSLQEVRTAFVLVLDDIGTKSQRPPVEPSYSLETSPGNFQYGYLIEPYDVSSPSGQAYYDSCLYSMALAGFNDPGFRSATRLARLPGSLHKTGFRARLLSMHAGRSWELPALMAEFGVPMAEPRIRQALTPGKYTQLREVDDPIYHWLALSGRVLGARSPWVYIDCPWRDSHTDGAQGPTATAYSPDGYGTEGAGFKCLHGHCAERDLAQFQQWALGEMLPPPDYLTNEDKK